MQQLSLILYNGNILTLTIYFIPLQQGWFITNLTYNATNFVLKGLRITVNPNMLYQFKNQIPFGLGCFTTLLREPSLQQDFSSGNFNLYILTQTEVSQYSQLLSLGPPTV